MENLTYEALLHDPEVLNRILRDARRERAEATGRLFLVALEKLFSRRRRPATRPTLQTSGCG